MQYFCSFLSKYFLSAYIRSEAFHPVDNENKKLYFFLSSIATKMIASETFSWHKNSVLLWNFDYQKIVDKTNTLYFSIVRVLLQNAEKNY